MMPLSMTLRSWLSRGLITLVKLKSQFLVMSIQSLLSLAVSAYQAMTHSTDYENKFVDASGVVFDLPVILQTPNAGITDMALKAYKALDMKGLCRIDFLVDQTTFHT